jgi:hypothetical protein
MHSFSICVNFSLAIKVTGLGKMSDASENANLGDNVRRLSDAIREARNAAAEREDVVVEMREAQRMRLEMLGAELKPLFDDVPADVDIFDFALSSGLQPRLWIDAVSHITMGRDRRTYRFLKDTRLGRVVLAESTDMKPVADQVGRYVADRMIERQRAMEGEVKAARKNGADASASAVAPYAKEKDGFRSFMIGLLLVLAGAAAGLIAVGAIYWDRLSALGINL